MKNLPGAEMILAGLFAQSAICGIIIYASEDICRLNGAINWILLIAVSVGVVILTAIRGKDTIRDQGILSFVGSFILSLTGYRLGYLALKCNISALSMQGYTYFATAIMVFASVVIIVHFLTKAPSGPSEINGNLPDSELILLGVCIQFVVSGCISLIPGAPQKFCTTNGIGSWLELLAVSGILTFCNFYKDGTSPKLLFTFVGTFITNLTVGGIGWLAIACSAQQSSEVILQDPSIYYGNATSLFHGATALIMIFTIFCLEKDPAPPKDLQAPAPQNALVIEAEYPSPDPMQGSCPAQAQAS